MWALCQLYVISCLLMPQSPPRTWLITVKVREKKKKEGKIEEALGVEQTDRP